MENFGQVMPRERSPLSCPRRRTIQYSRDSVIESISRGVLDRPVKPGDDGGLFDS